jgi:CDP-glucose 4,6-dehydratase
MNDMKKLFHGRYDEQRVFITGDTGFKGAWLAFWLQQLGAEVLGAALPPLYEKGPFVALNELTRHVDLDVRDATRVHDAINEFQPGVIFHLAAQALVRESYQTPRETAETNIMGTVNILEAVRKQAHPCAVVIVTSDKCYENNGQNFGYRENDPMGGHDVYSASKGCTELITAAYRRSFFADDEIGIHIATARAGNVMGPGDWAEHRIIPDMVRALSHGRTLVVRHPGAVRAWQHVLEPLSGYLWLGTMLGNDRQTGYDHAWNFGPWPQATCTVEKVVNRFIQAWGSGHWETESRKCPLHEAGFLTLDIGQAVRELHWKPVWSFDKTVRYTADGYRDWVNCGSPIEYQRIMQREIQRYVNDARHVEVQWANTP